MNTPCEWSLRPGVELRPGMSVPTRLVCLRCRAWFYARDIERPATAAIIATGCPDPTQH